VEAAEAEAVVAVWAVAVGWLLRQYHQHHQQVAWAVAEAVAECNASNVWLTVLVPKR